MDMTRGEMMDHLARFCSENEEYKSRLLADPKGVVAQQFGLTIPDNVSLTVVQDTPDSVHVVVPHVVAAGAELSDSDLEAVAGGMALVKEAKCGGGGMMNTVNAFG